MAVKIQTHCAVDGCDRQHYAHGHCQMHRRRVLKTGSAGDAAPRVIPSVQERLASRSVRQGECLIYTAGYTMPQGHVTIRAFGRNTRAHVAAWRVHTGEWPATGQVVRHKCDVPRCIEPNHLELGSVADNNRDRVERGRSNPPSGERNAQSKLTAADVLEIRALLATGQSQSAVGRRFGVGQSCISSIARGERWAHITEG